MILRRVLVSLLTLVCLFAVLPANADTTSLRADFADEDYLLILPRVMTRVDSLETAAGPDIPQYRWWTIAVIGSEGGPYRLLIERTSKYPMDPALYFEHQRINLVEGSESALIAGSGGVSFVWNPPYYQSLTLQVDVDLPEMGHLKFSVISYNLSRCPDMMQFTKYGLVKPGPDPNQCTQAYAWEDMLGSFSYEWEMGAFLHAEGSLNGELIVDDYRQQSYAQDYQLLTSVSGWLSFLHIETGVDS